MKIKLIQSLLLGAVLTTATLSTAIAREIPTAPADWLEKASIYSEDDIDANFLKNAEKLYKRKCKKCHGPKGDGKGSAAADLEVKPPAFNSAGYMDGRKDGQFFWILMNGSEGTDMEAYGPGTDVNLSEEELWQLIAYMRSAFTH